MSRVTIADVASAAGVSKTAVSFAFNSPERLGQATLERVLGVAQDLGYAPHPAARALSMKRSGTIGLLVPQRLATVFGNPFVSELIQGLGEQCDEHDLTLLLVPPLDGSLEHAIRMVSVDGFISLGLSPDDSAVRVAVGHHGFLFNADATGLGHRSRRLRSRAACGRRRDPRS